MLAVLKPHPGSTQGPVKTIEVFVDRRGDELWLRYLVGGDHGEVRWPEPTPPGRTGDLWRQTCFEAFVLTDEGYVEYNLSPSSEWASYRFDGYRLGMREAVEAVLNDGLNDTADVVDLQARIILPPGATRLGLSAVIETVDGAISYWALAHPSDKPDFHHPDSFVLELPPMEGQ